MKFGFLLLACLLLRTGALAALPAPVPVNIILVTADDLGLQLGCYGDSRAQTPRLDRFAAEGVRFLNAYVTQSSCSPSRSSLLTGLYPHQNGQIGLEHRGYAMNTGLPSAPSLLHSAGYRTGIIGKLHVAPREAFPFDFDRSADYATTTRRRDAMKSMVRDFFDGGDGRPFFLMVNFFDPHVPFITQVQGVPAQPTGPGDVEPWPFQGGIDSPQIRERIAGYYSGVARLDTLFGDLLDELEERGLAANTLVIFISDNGPPFTRAKASELPAGVHVPLLVRWPAEPGGTTSAGLVSGVDVFATVLDAAGLPPQPEVVGRSLRPLLTGKVPADWRTYVMTGFTAHQPFAFLPRRSVTDGTYRLTINLIDGRRNGLADVDFDVAAALSRTEAYDGSLIRSIFERLLQPPPVELYDLRSDPHGLYNVADDPEYSEIRSRLHRALSELMTSTQDPLRDASHLEKLRQRHDSGDPEQWNSAPLR